MTDRLLPALVLLAVVALALAVGALLLSREPDVAPPPVTTSRPVKIVPRFSDPPSPVVFSDPAPSTGEPPTPALPVPAVPLPAIEGDGPAFPNDLDPRFSEEQLRSVIVDALKAMDMPGDVVKVDCSEYPCLVVGKARGAIDAYSLRSVPVASAYEGDNIWFHLGPAIGEARAFAVGWTPAGAVEPETKMRIKLRQKHGVASVPADDLKAFFRN